MEFYSQHIETKKKKLNLGKIEKKQTAIHLITLPDKRKMKA